MWSKRSKAEDDRSVRLRDLSAPNTAAKYGGARLCADAAVVMRWFIDEAAVDVVYPCRWPGPLRAMYEPVVVNGARLQDRWRDDIDPSCTYVVEVGAGMNGPYGPDVTQHMPDGDCNHLMWEDLSRALGRPVPYWPYHLHDIEVLLTWRPGDPPVPVVPTPNIDTAPFTYLANTLPMNEAAHKALMLAIKMSQSPHSTGTLQDAQEFAGESQGRGTIEFPILPKNGELAPVRLSEEEQTVLRVGWREILQRRDGLARCAVRAARDYDFANKFFPYSAPIDLDSSNPFYDGIVSRLKPTPWTAGHERALRDYWFNSSHCQPLWDPATDTPAMRLSHDEVRLVSPHGTPAPITEVILGDDNDVWMRLRTGEVIPPVQNSKLDMTFGYSGGGTAAFGKFLKAWLTTDTPHAHQIDNEQPTKALVSITDRPWPAGTIITRDQVRRVENGEPPERVLKTRTTDWET